MEPIILFTGEDLVDLIEIFETIGKNFHQFNVYEVRFAIDDLKMKIKVNNHAWSPGLGKESI